jgi:hypothetical protein
VKLLRTLAALGALLALPCWVTPAAAATNGYGKLTGIVFDLAGTPQMGASVWVSPEAPDGHAATQILTDQNGIFEGPRLRPGFYSVRATLAGFLPAIQMHIHVGADLTTLVRIRLDSVFESLDQLRRQPAQPTETDDWKWVLRTSAANRPVLQLLDGTVAVASDTAASTSSTQRPARARVEMTNGTEQPGSPSALPGTLGTAVAYDQQLGLGRLFVAGQLGIDSTSNGGEGDALSGALASIWTVGGELGRGPQTTVVLRQVQPAPGRQIIRAMRVEHAEQLVLSDHLVLAYAGELVMGGVGSMTSTVRPRAQLTWRLTPVWSAAAALQTDPQSSGTPLGDSGLESVINSLSTAPVLLWRNGRVSSLEGAWHEELSVRRELGSRASLQAAAFHDSSGHLAVFGFDPLSNKRGASNQTQYSYGHDAGAGETFGTRVAYHQRLSNNLEVAAIYAYAGALAPYADTSTLSSNVSGLVHMQYRHSVAGRVAGKLPKGGTQFSASYKWLDGAIVGRQDLFGEAAQGVDPYLSFTLRQPLPSFHTGGHWEAVANFRNVFAQGYVPVNTAEGQLVLMPVERSFQGGVSFQF